ncbi:hypothetical protein sortregn_10 [Escherichia phage sortregn]|nr:hypothetical protein sortregn_10 [Escherichia phage sortregn]
MVIARKTSRRELWEAAQAAELDGMISAVSRVFGKEAIADISIETPDGEMYLNNPDPHHWRVVPGTKGGKNALKDAIADTKNRKHLKGGSRG